MCRRDAIACAALICVSFLGGCTSTKQSNTARTASEQLLISNAVDRSLDKVNFEGLAGTKILLEEKYLDCVDKGYIVGSLRDRIVHGGAELVAKPEEADIILEVRSGGIGTDMSNSFAGLPGITLPGMLSLPEIRLVSRERQKGIAKIAIVAYEAKTMRRLDGGGVATSVSDDNNWYVFGIGPYTHGTLHKELEEAEPSHPGRLSTYTAPEVVFAHPDSAVPDSSRLQHASAEEK